MLSSAEEYLEERNPTGKLDDSLGITSLREQNI